MKANKSNLLLFEKYKEEHLNDNGKVPFEFAITSLIENAIENKSYNLYQGDGRNKDGGLTKNYDVIVYFTLSGDPVFGVFDNCDGESKIYNCDNEGVLQIKYK
jgi:hypothetical protein